MSTPLVRVARPPADDRRSSGLSYLQRSARQRRSASGRSTPTGYLYVEPSEYAMVFALLTAIGQTLGYLREG